MRKHDVRKWLHAILDLLPVIIIPVFMIYSHRHTIDNYAIEVPQNEIVDFNQLQTQEYFSLPYSSGHTDYINQKFEVLNYSTGNNFGTPLQASVNCLANHKYYLKVTFYDLDTLSTIYYNRRSPFAPITDGENSTIYTYESDSIIELYTYTQTATSGTAYFNGIVIDLTQMFGSGNEPTLAQFEFWYSDDTYAYTLSKKELLKDVGTLTYNDTDIGSQMLYCLYNSVDKYFNLNNVFGFNNVYDWLSLNIFNGNPPIAIYIVWNIALYEFLMDLIMLLYALFMWFIDMCENLIDRSFNVASGRKK